MKMYKKLNIKGHLDKYTLSELIRIDYIFLDNKTCERCIGTDDVLREVVGIIAPALRLAGYRIEHREIEMSTETLATEYRFLSSPTIRVNGRDICLSVKENACGCCSDISGTDVDCRVFEYQGTDYEIPPKSMLAKAIFKAVFSDDVDGVCESDDYKMPDNLKTFFEGRDRRAGN
ncbi:MAG: DUF2703 domain-containing protein [Clostridiaceae bacterium]|nr:DUF2703 domain-containing protein [Clostridiaceae bacterium]